MAMQPTGTIADIVPEARPKFAQLLERASSWGLKPKISSVGRTCAQQAALYQQGSQTTQANLCRSWHVLGRAMDVRLSPDTCSSYTKLGEYWESIGGTWGGRWKQFGACGDAGHFQFASSGAVPLDVCPSGCSLSQCEAIRVAYLQAQGMLSPGLVPRRVTPLSPTEYTRELALAYLRLYGEWPHSNVLAVAAAIVGLENAEGKAIIQHNYGNISWVHQTPSYWEHPKPQAGAPLYFAAYETHADGARAWWRQIVKRNLPVLARAWSNDPKGAVAALYRTGYVAELHEGEEQGYQRAVARMYDEAHASWVPNSDRVRNTAGAVLFSLTIAGCAALALRELLA